MKKHTFSALEKFIPGVDVTSFRECKSLFAARGETVAFQFAVYNDENPGFVKVSVDGAGLDVSVRTVELIPANYTGLRIGGDVLTEEPGLFSDLLSPLPENQSVRLTFQNWKIFYLKCVVPAEAAPGKYKISVSLDGAPYPECPAQWEGIIPLIKTVTFDFEVEVDPWSLPEQTMHRLEWLHCDCLAAYYKVAAWSEEHWKIVENFAANAIDHGVDVLFTPLWTPPLDTGIGLERPDCQLLDISYDGGTDKYFFNFSRLERFIEMGKRLNFRAFSMSHIFTQWGAAKTPKIMVRNMDNGKLERMFGWDVDADSDKYFNFLSQLLPQLLPVLRKCGKKCFFSLSDEPGSEHLEHYRKLVMFVRPLLEEFDTIEAMSHIDFYEQDLVRHPIASLTSIEKFRGIVPELYGYYCVSQPNCTNRFFKMPLARTRIFGVLSYVYDLKFFLQWGYNFYFTQYSIRLADPFKESDADFAFPAGDAFLVYPGSDGKAWDSLRGEAFYDGLQDRRMLELLEEKIGRDAVLKLIHQGLDKELTMTDFPAGNLWLTELRERVREALRG